MTLTRHIVNAIYGNPLKSDARRRYDPEVMSQIENQGLVVKKGTVICGTCGQTAANAARGIG